MFQCFREFLHIFRVYNTCRKQTHLDNWYHGNRLYVYICIYIDLAHQQRCMRITSLNNSDISHSPTHTYTHTRTRTNTHIYRIQKHAPTHIQNTEYTPTITHMRIYTLLYVHTSRLHTYQHKIVYTQYTRDTHTYTLHAHVQVHTTHYNITLYYYYFLNCSAKIQYIYR